MVKILSLSLNKVILNQLDTSHIILVSCRDAGSADEFNLLRQKFRRPI